jgi:hypothetical protein
MNAQNKNIEVSTQAIQMAKLEIDTQIATAKQFPRDIAKFKKNALAMIQGDKDLAASCTYHLTRKKKEGGQAVIEGPSIRLAEVVMSTWGNMRTAARINDYDEKWIYTQAFSHDLETNVRVEIEVKRKITGRDKKTYSDDMIQTTGAAAMSIAIRNAIFKVVPFSYVNELRKQAQKIALGTGGKKEKEKEKWLAYFESEHEVSRARVFAKFEVKNKGEMKEDHFHTLMGIHTALQEGSTTIEQEFPIQAPESTDEQPEN